MPFKHMRLTRQKIRVPMGTSTKVVRKAWTKNDVTQKWNESALAKKLAARRLKANMNDFDRFKLRRAKQSVRTSWNLAVIFSYCSRWLAVKSFDFVV